MSADYSDNLLNNRYRFITVTLQPFGSVGDRASFNLYSRYFTLIDATFSTESDISLSLNDDPFQPIFKSIQMDFRDNPVEKITLLNTNAAANTVKLAVSAIAVVDNRSTVTGSVIISGGVSVNPATIIDSLPDIAVPNTTATKILTGAADIREAWIQNPEALGGTSIRIGDSGVSASNGIILPPQGIYIANIGAVTTGDIYAYHSKGSTINMPVTVFKG